MSQFVGSKNKVRCIDCTKLLLGKCAAKNVLVSPKKKRACTIYEFKGEYDNRTPASAIYSPYMDKKTRKAINRLINLGINPVNVYSAGSNPEGYKKTKSLPMPASTATATHLGVVEVEDPMVYNVELPVLDE